MSIGLPKLELVFKAAAETAAARSKQGVAAVIVLESAAQDVRVVSCARAGELSADLGVPTWPMSSGPLWAASWAVPPRCWCAGRPAGRMVRRGPPG